ncbi:MAG: D-alanine--D-alanine ligase [Chloroflexota bacterium]
MTLPRSSITVLLGGPSAEHDVSLVSGRAIASALADRGHDVSGWLIDLEARWWPLPVSGLDVALPLDAFRDPMALGSPGPSSASAALERLAGADPRPIVFPALHGPFGEDGEVQALLESVELSYCGSGPAASAVGMDKSIFKRVCSALGLMVLPWLEVRASEHAANAALVEDGLAEFAAGLPDPRLVVKPARMGSSIGISIVHQPHQRNELRAALDLALLYDDLAIAEAYLDHPRELEIGLLGNDPADTIAYGPGEIVPGREFYDYVAKYRSDLSITSAEADLEPQVAADARTAALEVFAAIGASGFARVDMLMSQDGTMYISEINTIPGFTPISLFPRMTARAGLDFGSTCERIVELALQRHASRPARRLRPADLP